VQHVICPISPSAQGVGNQPLHRRPSAARHRDSTRECCAGMPNCFPSEM
jgi:hypothetical protein